METIALDSKLDWGQIVARLAKFVRNEHISHIWLDVGKGWSKYGLPGQDIPHGHRVKGWIAVVEQRLQMSRNDNRWLKSIRPVRRVGQTIRVYYIPE